jgi:hypothetical protein
MILTHGFNTESSFYDDVHFPHGLISQEILL